VRFPRLDSIPLREDWPDENMCSVAIRIRYGRFAYFTGGDMPGYPVPGAAAWHDEETDVAKAIGPTDVHLVNHHGSLEEENPFWLATPAFASDDCPCVGGDSSLPGRPEANAVAPHLP
jgi:hypothetical protein